MWLKQVRAFLLRRRAAGSPRDRSPPLSAPKHAPPGTSHLHGTWCRLHAPDHVSILRDSSISGELCHGGGRLDAELAPLGFVRVGCVHFCLGINEGGEVMHHQVPVTIPGACTVRVAELVNQRAKLGVSLRLTLGELAVANCLGKRPAVGCRSGSDPPSPLLQCRQPRAPNSQR